MSILGPLIIELPLLRDSVLDGSPMFIFQIAVIRCSLLHLTWSMSYILTLHFLQCPCPLLNASQGHKSKAFVLSIPTRPHYLGHIKR